MTGVESFLAMSGYAFYVWSSYGITALILAGIMVTTLRRARRTARRLENLKAAAPHRRRRREEDGHGA